jgi:hypothetical protein
MSRTEATVPAPSIDAKADIEKHVRKLALENQAVGPVKIWEKVKTEMGEKFPNGWHGHTREYVKGLVGREQKETNFGDKFEEIKNTDLRFMADSGEPFLHFHRSVPNPQNKEQMMQLMVFANPELLLLVDLFLNSTWDCTPAPFKQTYIIMCHDQQTGKYVPVITILMTHFNQYLNWEALTRVVVLSDWKLDVGSYTTDFERAVMNECAQHFPKGVHIGCFFHLKQAIRKHMPEKLNFDGDVVSSFMETGAFDLLMILPHGEVEQYRIDYLLSQFEPDTLSAEEQARWVEFWNYLRTSVVTDLGQLEHL